jgi:hypothetical protein
MEYHIYPSFHEGCASRVENILKNLVENFSNELKIWRFDNLRLNVEKKTALECLTAFRNSRMLLCFLTKDYIDHDLFKFDFLLADSCKKRILILVIDDIADEKLNELREYNSEISIINVSKQILFFESGCFCLFIQFIEDTDRCLQIYKYNSRSNSLYSCVPVYHFKCRFDPNDRNCVENVYTRTNNIFVRLEIKKQTVFPISLI